MRWQFFSSNPLKVSFYLLWPPWFLRRKPQPFKLSSFKVMGCFPPGVFRIFFFFICLNSLMIIYQRVFHLVYSVWNSWICKFISFLKFGKFSAIISSNCLLCVCCFFFACFYYTVYPLLWDSCNTNIKPLLLNQDPWGSF